MELPKLKAPKNGDALSPSLASLINTACTSQCEVEKIISKYKLPSHCDKMAAPAVNSEIWTDIVRRTQTYDKPFQNILTLTATGMVPITKLVSLIKSQMSDEAKSSVSDAITLLGQAQLNISLRRRYMNRPFLKKKYSAFCNIATPITTQLFGDDLNNDTKNVTKVYQWPATIYGNFLIIEGRIEAVLKAWVLAFRTGVTAMVTMVVSMVGRGYARCHPYDRQ